MLILVPPSEGKAAPRRGRPLDPASLSFPELAAPRAEVLDALVALCTSDDPADAARVLGLGPTQGEEVRRDAALRDAPAARADRVYSGVLYEALDLGSLDGAARRRATSRLAVTSALFGLLRPGDRIPAYRLSGGVSLPGLGAVSAHWSRRLDPAVRAAVGRGLVVDLRSSTYASFWRPARDLAPRVVSVRVLQEHDGRRAVVSHLNKATKGRLVRDLLLDGGTPATPGRFADLLGSLGWKVQPGPAGRHGALLDVVVSEV